MLRDISRNQLHRVCSICETINFTIPDPSQRPRRQPQALYTDLLLLEKSSIDGCHLCTLIFYALYLKNGGSDMWKRNPDGPVKVICKKNEDVGTYLEATCNDFGYAHLRFSRLDEARGLLPAVDMENALAENASSADLSPQTQDILPTAQVQGSPTSAVIFSQIAKWMDLCVTNHASCYQDSNKNLPRRLIDVGPRDGSLDPRLMNTTSGTTGKYVTLSYRWGTCPTLTTTSLTFSSHVAGIPMEKLPATLRDSIWTTRKLGLRYIWIDSLCIIQDSPEDWAEQAALMASIYQNAWVTISADSAVDSAAGFLGTRDVRAIRSCHHASGGVTIHPEIPPLFKAVDQGGLNQRGWTLQERMFSNRIIHWSHLEVGWECQELQASERDSDGVRDFSWRGSKVRQMLLPMKGDVIDADVIDSTSTFQSVDLTTEAGQSKDTARDVYDAWYALVEEYSERLLSYPDKDKLIALSGIATTFHQKYLHILGPESAYLSGLWKYDLPRGLAYTMSSGEGWRAYDGLDPIPKCDPERPETWTFRAPSFSWTGLDDKVQWLQHQEGDQHLHEHDVQVVKTYSVAVDLEPWSPLQTQWIILRGVVLSKEEMKGASSTITAVDPDQPYSSDLPLRTRFLRLSVIVDSKGLYDQTWLIVHPVSTNIDDGFRRLGIRTMSGKFTMDCKVMTEIKLV